MKLFGHETPRHSTAFLFLMISVGFSVLVSGYYLGVFRSDARRLAALHGELQQRERSLTLSDRLVSQHPGVLRRLRVNDTALLAGLGLSNPAVALMTKSAQANGLDLDLVEPGSVEKIGSQRRTPVSLRLRGQYVEFLSWLREIEASDVLVTVDQVFMEGSPTGRHLFRVVLSTYAYSKEG